MLRAIAVITSVFLAQPARAEPPCHIPTCMGELSGIGKGRAVFADAKTELRIVDAQGQMVLVEIVRDGAPGRILPAFVIAAPPKVDLVPFGGDLKRPLVTFAGPWTTAKDVVLEGVTLARSTKTLDGKAVFARYKAQRQHDYALQQHQSASEQLAKHMVELNTMCGTKITHEQVWAKVPDAFFETSMRDADHVCEDNFHALVEGRCNTAAGRAVVAAKLKHVRCIYKPTGGLVMKLDPAGTLAIELSLSADRERQGSKAQRFLEPRLQ